MCQCWFDARVYSGVAIFILDLPGVKSRFYASCPSQATLTNFRAAFGVKSAQSSHSFASPDVIGSFFVWRHNLLKHLP